MTSVERVADQYRIIFEKAAKKINKDIVITDEDLREIGIEPQVSRTVSDEFDEIMKNNPNIVERTASDAFLQELEEEIEKEEQLKSQSQPESEPETEDEFEIIENTNIPSVENKKPKRFGIFGGNKPIDERSTKDLLLFLSKMINQRNKLTIDLNLLDTRKKQIMDSNVSAELKKKRLLSVLKAWINVRKGVKPSEYSQKIKDLNTRINTLKKYLREKRDITNDTLEVVEDGWETIDKDELAEARQQPVTPSKPKKSSWFGGKTKVRRKSSKKSHRKKSQRKNKQYKKKSTRKQRKSQLKKKTKKNKK